MRLPTVSLLGRRVALACVTPLVAAIGLSGIATFFALGQWGLARSFGIFAVHEWRLAWNGDLL